MTWLYYSLGAAISLAFLNILSRILTVKSRNPRAFSIVFNIICIIMSLILFIVVGSYRAFSLPTRIDAWIYLLIASFFYGLNERFRFLISKILEASIYSIISNITVIIAFFISFFLYKESLTVTKLLGSIFILFSLLLVSELKKSKISSKGIFLGVLTSIYLGVAMSLDKKGAIFFNPETYNILLWVVPFIVLYFPGIKIEEIKVEFKQFSWRIILLAFFNFVGFYFGLKAFILADATKVIPVIQTTTLMTVIAGIFLLKERSYLPKKILAGIIAIAGVFLLR
ncbi:MAG: DMT family transporter [Patescibacteria group bacterium]|jgi:drug/metabolite transporter (DMT)-like permease